MLFQDKLNYMKNNIRNNYKIMFECDVRKIQNYGIISVINENDVNIIYREDNEGLEIKNIIFENLLKKRCMDII